MPLYRRDKKPKRCCRTGDLHGEMLLRTTHSGSCGTVCLPRGRFRPGTTPTETPLWSIQSSGGVCSSSKVPFHVDSTVVFFNAFEPYLCSFTSRWSTVSLLFIALTHKFLSSSSVCQLAGLSSPRWIRRWHRTFHIKCTVSVIKIRTS